MSVIEIILSKAGGTALVILLMLGVTYLLRYLYGPGGRLRDPHWDRMNTLARVEAELDKRSRVEGTPNHPFPDPRLVRLARGLTRKANPEAFLLYAQTFFNQSREADRYLKLKQDHSLRVLEQAALLALQEEVFSCPTLRRSLLLAALYHDIGRFEQFHRYQTFSDARSCDHGALGAKVLRRNGFLGNEPEHVQKIVLAAVGLHNRIRIPEKIREPYRAVLCALRDADKLDIIAILTDEFSGQRKEDNPIFLHLIDDPAKCSPALLDSLKLGQPASYGDMRYINDFRLMLCNWVNDLNFISSVLFLQKSGRLNPVVEGLAQVPEARMAAREALENSFRRAEEAAAGKEPATLVED